MIGVRVSKELRALIQAEADADKRTISQIGKLAIIAYLEKKGRLKPQTNGSA